MKIGVSAQLAIFFRQRSDTVPKASRSPNSCLPSFTFSLFPYQGALHCRGRAQAYCAPLDRNCGSPLEAFGVHMTSCLPLQYPGLMLLDTGKAFRERSLATHVLQSSVLISCRDLYSCSWNLSSYLCTFYSVLQ